MVAHFISANFLKQVQLSLPFYMERNGPKEVKLLAQLPLAGE